jgi:hypothetical protein
LKTEHEVSDEARNFGDGITVWLMKRGLTLVLLDHRVEVMPLPSQRTHQDRSPGSSPSTWKMGE